MNKGPWAARQAQSKDHKHEWSLHNSLWRGKSRCQICGRHVRTSTLSALRHARSVKRTIDGIRKRDQERDAQAAGKTLLDVLANGTDQVNLDDQK